MAIHLKTPQGLWVLTGIEHRLVVCSPRCPSGGQGNLIRKHLSGHQVLEMNRVLAATYGVHTKRKQTVVIANTHPANSEVVVPFSKCVLVKHDLLFTRAVRIFVLIPCLLPTADCIFLSLLVTGVIPVPPISDRNAPVVLLDSAHDFIEQLLLKRFSMRQLSVDVSIFRLEVVQHILRLLIWCFSFLLSITQTHPEIIVNPGVPVQGHFKGHLLGHGGHSIIRLRHVVRSLAGCKQNSSGQRAKGAKRMSARQKSSHEIELNSEK